ncbi:MAG: NigD-like protein [Prevotella sp.]
MKQMKWMAWAMFFVLTATGLQSCDDDDDDKDWYNGTAALVTIKTDANGAAFIQLDDSTTLTPVNMKEVPYGKKEMRVLTLLRPADDDENVANSEEPQRVYVDRIDTLLNKRMATNMGDENSATYGNDPVEIIRDWKTVAEDGYLTLVFATDFGHGGPHRVNLVATPEGDNQYVVTFYHDASADTIPYYRGQGIVAFKLDQLPSASGETVTLTLKWNSYSGEKSHDFKLKMR